MFLFFVDKVYNSYKSTTWNKIYEVILFPKLIFTCIKELFGIKQNGDESSNYSSGGTQKVKEKTKPNKKRKALDTYGTNLTVKAKNNQIDRVIGRDKEIERLKKSAEKQIKADVKEIIKGAEKNEKNKK